MLARDIDVDGLEASLSLLSSKYTKKTTTSKSEMSPRHHATTSPRFGFEVHHLPCNVCFEHFETVD